MSVTCLVAYALALVIGHILQQFACTSYDGAMKQALTRNIWHSPLNLAKEAMSASCLPRFSVMQTVLALSAVMNLDTGIMRSP